MISPARRGAGGVLTNDIYKMNSDTIDLGADETCVLQFLNHWPGSFVSGAEIARRADSKARFEDDPRWANLALSQLTENGLLESDGHGKYRVKGSATIHCFGGQRRFVAPHLKEILERHRRKLELSS